MRIDRNQINALAKMGQNKAFFGIALPELAQEYDNLFAVTADLCGYCGMGRFARLYPDRTVNVGIQEQGMLSVAAGIAMEGNIVYAGSYASFAVARAMEQIRHNLSVLGSNVKLVGYCAGYSMGTLGKSHWATEDLAFTRCLPDMTVMSPADSLEAVKACRAAAQIRGPVYIRLCGDINCPAVYHKDYVFETGKAIRLRDGKDAAVIATGRMVHQALMAAELLYNEGIDITVVNMHTIKPLDTDILDELSDAHGQLFTVEEHNIVGGLGSAVSEYMADRGCGMRLTRLGMRDCHYEIGDERYVWEQAGLMETQIAETIIANIDYKRVGYNDKY